MPSSLSTMKKKNNGLKLTSLIGVWMLLVVLFGIFHIQQSTRVLSNHEISRASWSSSESRKRYMANGRRTNRSSGATNNLQTKKNAKNYATTDAVADSVQQKEPHQLPREHVVDILSIGSNTRPEYYKAQRNTWADHSLIRHFFVATEDDDDHDPQCLQNTLRLTHQFSHFCKDRYMTFSPIIDEKNETDVNGNPIINLTTAKSWLMNRYVHKLASPHFMKKKADPIGWLCAQTRFPLAISKVLLGYSKRNETLPDYLLLVDDDTYYNLDHYEDAIVKGRDSSKPYVAAACRSRMPTREYTTFPIGGFGMTISKGSIQRFITPIHISKSHKPPFTASSNYVVNDDVWERSVLHYMEENLLLEQPTFRNGMSLIELMDAFTREEKISEIHKWTRGFCLHGDWIIPLFVMIYNIGGLGPIVDTVYDSEAIRKERRGICRNDGDMCWANSLACHYQTPADMKRLTQQAKRHVLDGNWTGIQKERARDQLNYTLKIGK